MEIHDVKLHGIQQVNSPLLGVIQYDSKGNFKKLRTVFACHNSINRGLLTADYFPLRVPREMIEEAGQYELYTIIDLADAFHSIALRECDYGKQAFILNQKTYVFKRAVMGVPFMPSLFQRFLSSLFQDLPGIAVYLDDIWIMTDNNMEKHVLLVEEVLKRITEAKLRVNPKKTKFITKKFRGLGFTITPEGVTIDPDRIEN